MQSFRHLLPVLFTFLCVHLSAQTYVSGTIDTYVEWGTEGSPYIIEDSLLVSENGILVLREGTIIMFKYHPLPEKKSYMRVAGELRMWTGSLVVFTSERDDSFGDFNGDGNASIPRPGDWGYIRLESIDPGSNELGISQAIIKYGGGRNPDSIDDPELYPMVDFCLEEEEGNYSSFWASDTEFLYSKGCAVRAGALDMNGCRIANCTNGLYLSSNLYKLTGTTIENNTKFPLISQGMMIPAYWSDYNSKASIIKTWGENIIRNNGLNYFALEGSIYTYRFLPDDAGITSILQLQNYGIPYLITGDLTFSDINVEVEKGSLLKFKYYPESDSKVDMFFDEQSSLTTYPAEDARQLVFTSEFDHRYDFELFTGKHPDPMGGDWGCINAYSLELENCVFKYGGKYANPVTGIVSSDSSAVLRVHLAKEEDGALISSSMFNSLYAHGLIYLYEGKETTSGLSTSQTSFLLNKKAKGIQALKENGLGESLISAENNYWYGKYGPYHRIENTGGNGCLVGDNISFKPFLTESDAEMELVSSVISGVVRNLDGEPLPKALVKISGKKGKDVYSREDGSYYASNIYPGYGYEIHTFAARHFDTIADGITVAKDTSLVQDIYLRPRVIQYIVDTITFKVNPDVSEVQEGGTAHRYYKIVDRKTLDPVYGAEVFIYGLADTFYTDYSGIVSIPIASDKVGPPNYSKRFYFTQIGIESLPLTTDLQMPFKVKVLPREYTKMWAGKLWLKEGISVVELKQEIGASVGLQVEGVGDGETAEKLILERGFKAGAGINLSASAKAKLGPVEAGAEAEVGVNLSAYMQDQFIFDYENYSGEHALAKFMVLAGSMYQYLDCPLLRYLGVALLNDLPYVDEANFSNSVGLNLQGYGSAEAGLSANFKDDDGSETPFGAELKGSAQAEANWDFLFTAYNHSDQLDFALSYGAELGLGVNAGIGFDLTKLFGGDDNAGSDKDEDKKDDDDFEIKLPDLFSLGASGGVKFGAAISTCRNIPDPYTSLSFMYGYKYSLGAQALVLWEAALKQDIEYNFTFDFHDAYLKRIVEEKVALAKEIANTDINNLSLDVSGMSGANFFSSPFATFAAEQTKNAFSYPPIPYNHTIKEIHDDGEISAEISFGLGPVKVKLGGGLEYSEANDYLWRSGVFYDWKLYPLQSYEYIPDNDAFSVGPILQDLLTESGAYLWEQIKEQLIPPIFKKIKIWPFNKLKKGDAYEIPIGPDSRNSMLYVDELNVEDSVFVYYWDWYGTEGLSRKKSTLAPEKIKILENLRSKATEIKKLDYGIGGFYQFEPNGKVIADSAVICINYYNDELELLLPDSTVYYVNESDLRLYAEDKANSSWVYVGGEVDTVNNLVKARIDSLGTFTLAPFIPVGDLNLHSSEDTIFVEISNHASIESDVISYNTGYIIRDDEEFTLQCSKGTVMATDMNPDVPGIQVLPLAGKISFNYQSDSISGVAYISAESRKGSCSGLVKIFIVDEDAPAAPVLNSVVLNDYVVEVNWQASEDVDVSNYEVLFGTRPGGPYNGTASVEGTSSPVRLGTETSTRLKGLYKDSTYYFVVRALDRCSNVSDYSNEMMLKTSFNHRPVIYERVFKIEPSLPNGSVVDTLWARDEDSDQELSYYFTSDNTCTAFNLDAKSGVLTVKDESQLDYYSTGRDSLYLKVGVEDDAVDALADSTTVLVILDVDYGIRRKLNTGDSWFKVFPNPATDWLQVEFSEDLSPASCELYLYDLQGKLIERVLIEIADRQISDIDISKLDAGIYFIRLESPQGRGVQRFVVM